jgi:hypoxanthine phosphoribosyltransferase
LKSALKVIYSPARIRAQVTRMGREISRTYGGRTLDVVILLQNAFVFAADLVRQISIPVAWHFVRADMHDVEQAGHWQREIFFSERPDLKGRDVLVVDSVLQSGVTQEFLVRRLSENEPRSLRLAVLLDKPQERKVELQADYFGFRAASNHVVGYGLPGNAGAQRNLPYIAGAGQARRKTRTAGRPAVRGQRKTRR